MRASINGCMELLPTRISGELNHVVEGCSRTGQHAADVLEDLPGLGPNIRASQFAIGIHTHLTGDVKQASSRYLDCMGIGAQWFGSAGRVEGGSLQVWHD